GSGGTEQAWRAALKDDTSRSVFFFNDTATTEIYTLSLHDALPISTRCSPGSHTVPITQVRQGESVQWRTSSLPPQKENYRFASARRCCLGFCSSFANG